MKNILKKIIICLVFISFSSSIIGQRLTVSSSGYKILKNGNPITLRGVNFGNWLVWEGYMMDLDSDGHKAPSQIRASIKDLLGNDEAKTVTFENNWRNSYITNSDFAKAKALGYNVIRIPFHYNMFWNTATGTLKSDGFTWLDKTVNWAKANNIYVIFCLHAAPGYQSPTYTCDNPSTASSSVTFWSNWTNVNITGDVWKSIANHYKNYIGNEWIAGYDLLNEPVVESTKINLLYSYKEMTAKIRAVDTNHLIFAQGNYYGSDFYDMQERWDSNLVFENHYYGGQGEANPNPDLATRANLANSKGIPLWTGEFGENTSDWVKAARIDYETMNQGWAFWAWKRQSTDRSIYTFNGPAGWNTITGYIKFGGTKPSVSNVVTWLNEYCTVTKLENSTYNSALQDKLLPAKPFGNIVWLSNNGKYVTSNNGVGAITADRTSMGAWEKYTVVDAGDWKIALKGNNGKYVNCQNGLSAMTCSSATIGGWEAFEWVDVNGSVALKGFNGKFVSSEGGATTGINCNRETVSGWEAFNWGTSTTLSRFENTDNSVEETESSILSVYPNPVLEKLNYSYPKSFNSHVATIYTILGEKYASYKVNSSTPTNSIDISDLTPGIYVLQINNETEIKTKTIIKK